MDLGFLITGTSPNDNTWYKQQILFLKKFMKRQTIGNQDTRVAGAVNGISPNVIFSFNDGKSLSVIERYIDDVSNPGMPSNMKVITKRISDDMFSTRSGARGRSVPKTLLLLVTEDIEVNEVKSTINTLKYSGIQTVVVAVGDSLDKPKLLDAVEDKKDIIFIDDAARVSDVMVNDASGASMPGMFGVELTRSFSSRKNGGKRNYPT